MNGLVRVPVWRVFTHLGNVAVRELRPGLPRRPPPSGLTTSFSLARARPCDSGRTSICREIATSSLCLPGSRETGLSRCLDVAPTSRSLRSPRSPLTVNLCLPWHERVHALSQASWIKCHIISVPRSPHLWNADQKGTYRTGVEWGFWRRLGLGMSWTAVSSRVQRFHRCSWKPPP